MPKKEGQLPLPPPLAFAIVGGFNGYSDMREASGF
jgi:hypothetical protein